MHNKQSSHYHLLEEGVCVHSRKWMWEVDVWACIVQNAKLATCDDGALEMWPV